MIELIIAVLGGISLLWVFLITGYLDWLCSRIVYRAKKYRHRHRSKRLILIRHGQSQGNQDTTIYCTVPDHAIGLTEHGREQARHCGQQLKALIGDDENVFFYVSPFRRSRETCQVICQAFPSKQILGIRDDPRIREQEWGNFQDLATRDRTVVEREKIGRFFYRFKDGESGADVYDRVSLFIDSLFREMDNHPRSHTNICIVTHGLFIRLFLMRFYRWPVEKFHTLANFDNCEYCILERDDRTGSFLLKTELKTYPDAQSLIEKIKSNDIQAAKSFAAEINPKIRTDEIGYGEKKA